MNLDELKKEAKSKKTSAARLEELSRHSDTGIQLAVAKNLYTSSTVLENLTRSNWVPILRAVARHPNTSPRVLDTLAQDHRYSVASAVLYNPHTDTKTLEKLAWHSLLRVRIVMPYAENCPAKARVRLVADSKVEVRKASANSRKTPAYLLAQLARDSDAEVRAAVASNPNTPLEVVEILTDDLEESVRSATLWREEALPEDWLVRLSTDPSPSVRQAVICHPSTSISVLQEMVTQGDLLKSDVDDFVLQQLAQRADLPLELFIQVCNRGSRRVRRALVRNPNTPSEILDLMVKDTYELFDEIILIDLLNHPNTSRLTLETLTQSDSPSMQKHAQRALDYSRQKGEIQ